MTPRVALQGISKRFGATVAVDGVDLDVEGGSIHALVGENGAGKSTVAKIIAGVHEPDAGEVRLEGEPVAFRSPRQALERGITMIAQELSLVPTRDVVDNVYLGLEDRRGPFLDRRRMERRFARLVEETGISVPPAARVGALGVAQQQQVEILRALAREASLIVMDEPSARLSASETRALHAVVRALAERGTAVIYVSHFLDEVLELADTVTVMRDGKLVKSGPTANETPDSLVVAMVGRSLAATFPEHPAVPDDADEVLRVEGLVRRGMFRDVSFTVRAGEIVGMAGLVGAGRTEVARTIFGADRRESGRVVLCGRELHGGVDAAISAGIAMIPESRKDQGLLLTRPVRENVTLPHLAKLSRLGMIDPRAENARVEEAADEVGVKRATSEQPAASLSGGNQQKLLFARWLLDEPRLLIADEPTRGVDIAAKRAIYDLIVRLASDGMAILLISSELEEVLGLSHRVLVMRNGEVVAEFKGEEATEQACMEAAFGTGLAEAPA